jgi:hypothetical protein
MEKQIDVMKRTLELSETMGEALEHIKNQVNEGKAESTIQLANDTMTAFASIVQGMRGFLNELPPNQVEEYTDKLLKGFDVLITAYEQHQDGKILEVLQFNVLPAYKKWNGELVQYLQPYLVS